MQFLTKIISNKFIKQEMDLIGFDENYLDFGVNKHKFLNIKIFELTPEQANIIKQTALSSGCDCATHKGVINHSIKKSNCILSGSLSQVETVAKKLQAQPFSLSELSGNLLELLENHKKTFSHSKIMGILNLTSDSFSDGGEFLEINNAINHAVDMIDEGAQVIDIGAQATNPNAHATVSIAQEINRITPLVVALKTAYPKVEISVDTTNLATIQSAIQAGCDIINDVSFLRNEEFIELAKKYNKKLVIMHSRGTPQNMDKLAKYKNVADEVYKALFEKVQYALLKGLNRENIIVDLGFGFAKNIEQNFVLLDRIEEFKSMGLSVLAGVSRKRFLQDVINTKEPKDADIQTLLTTSLFIQKEIDYIRVHNVKLSQEAVKFNERLYCEL